MLNMEYRGRTWKAQWSEGGSFSGWRAICKLPPPHARNICEIFETADDEDAEDVSHYLRSVGVIFDGEVIDVICLKTEVTRTILAIVVSCVSFCGSPNFDGEDDGE